MWNVVTSVNIAVITIESHCKICNSYCRITYLFPGYRSAGFLAYLSSHAGTTSGAYIQCDTEVYDYGDNYNPSTGIYTVPYNGSYLIHARVYGRHKYASHYIRVDGDDVTYAFEHDPVWEYQSTSTSVTLPLVAGQKVVVVAWFDGTLTGSADYMATSFGATLIHPD